jgi:putative PIN family toxin of toxin-antitoxin system
VTEGSGDAGTVAVFDTNALLRVALAKSPLARAMRDAWEQGTFLLLVSDEILEELRRVLRYRRIVERYALTETIIQDFEASVQAAAVCVPGLYSVAKIEADPSDDKFLACALEGDADFIVSNDAHLRELKHYQGIQIISLEQFSTRIGLS